MFDLFRKKRINEYTKQVSVYLRRTFIIEQKPVASSSVERRPNPDIRYSLGEDVEPSTQNRGSDIRYSLGDLIDDSKDTGNGAKDADKSGNVLLDDRYSTSEIAMAMQKYKSTEKTETLLKDLEKVTNKTFVDALIDHINKKGLRDSEVYKAAQIDRRLFSKIMSDRQYKPSKDTAIAIALALRLTLGEATDMLSRAGYTFSHSNKKDIIVEYFFRERIYKLDDINEVLYNLGQKIIGR